MGRPKPLALLRGVPLVRHAALALAGGGHDGLLAVLPPGEVGASVRAVLADLPFTFAVNPEPGRGLASSFRVAAAALPPGLAGANFALADMPLVTAPMHAALVRALRETGAPAVLARYADPGHEPVRAPPHVLGAALLADLHGLPDADHGPRVLLRAHGAGVLTLTFPAAHLLDVDTPEALAQAEAWLAAPPLA